MAAADPASASASVAPVLIAGRYRVEAALGKGGAAQVYRVRDLVSHAELALKRLKPGASQKLTRLFEREYQTLASLNHPGTVEVFDYGRDEEGPFYTMELLQGEDLKARSPMPWREACGYLRDAAQTLGLLHARKLIHRDVSARNLWRMPNGHAKLLDFGAVMPFGPNDHLLGTPPLVPPEALRGERLDQRADLYSLGAVGYYLLCGTHAFPAREFEDLHALWKQPPEPVSERVARLARPELEDIPPELDQLLGALLSPEVLARPSNTPELIDRLDTLLDGDRPSQVEVAELHLSNTAYVGREGARRHLHRQLQVAALGGRGQSTVLQGAPGQGRSRLLKELALQARVLPATVLLVPVANYPGLYGVATALALKLLDALPEQARAAALPHAGLLAHASSRLRERLGVQPVPALEAVELRVRIQAAFRDWFLQVAKRHALVLLIDGFEQVDDGSGAFLLALAQARKGARLMLVCTLLDERKRVHGALTRALQKTSHQRVLSGLSEPETLALLHSVFDGAEHVPRLASRLHKATEGNPGHLLELCRQLVSRNVIGFSHGSWLLPQEVALEHLASTREQALTARLLQLSSAARKLGRVLSAYPGPVPPELARALAETLSPNALLALGELQNEDVLSQDEAGLHFLHEPVRLQLASELTPTQRHAAQRAIGHYLSSLPAPSLVERLCAGVNLLASADQRGADMIASASLRMALGEPAQLRYALPYLEEGLRLFRAQKRPAREQIALLVALSMAGYYCDRRYALRYGELTIGALEEVLGLERARKLSHVWGKKLSLWMALAIAAIQLGVRRANPRVPSFRDALLLLFACVGTLAGSAAVCLDAEAAQRYGEVLSPFQALGPRSMAGFVYEYCSALSASLRDAWGAALFRWQQLIARLDRGEVRDMPESLRVRFLGGALFTSGVLQAQRDGEAALRTAERLEQLGMALDRMSADQVRTVFYAHQGNAALFGEYAERAELHAIQQGSSWQIETWFASSKSAVDLRTRDLMGQKHASEQLQRMSQTVPSLDLAARRARGAYLMMRKKYAEALPWLEECLQEEPLSTAGWSCMHGVLARTYNKLGEFERARTTCLRALSVLKPEDFVLTGMYLIVQTEVLVAEAGLGRGGEAEGALRVLIAQHAPHGGPLTLGQLHEAGVEIALLSSDEAGARHHLAQAKRWYLSTGLASLVQHCAGLSARVQGAAQGTSGSPGSADRERRSLDPPSVDSSISSSTVDRMLAGDKLSLRERAHKALQILAEHARCTHGFLYLLDAQQNLDLVASLKDEPEVPSLRAWLARRLASEREEAPTLDDQDESNTQELHLMFDGTRSYRVLMLETADPVRQGVLGAAVVASTEGAPAACPAEVVAAVAFHLQRGLARASSASLLPG